MTAAEKARFAKTSGLQLKLDRARDHFASLESEGADHVRIDDAYSAVKHLDRALTRLIQTGI